MWISLKVRWKYLTTLTVILVLISDTKTIDSVAADEL